MPDRIFVDTNVLVYFISDDKKKKLKARDIIFTSEEVFVSSQVISEFVSVCFSKKLLSSDKTTSVASHFMEALNFSTVGEATIISALQIKKKAHCSFWDSLIVAAALENNCSILYTEDMHDGQVIDGKLTVRNPFKS
ncbi:MAG: PIN domain-containing protein [Nitrospirae bacterium]|nr:PIN domain-containing protein [Nitrospirota bacterium]